MSKLKKAWSFDGDIRGMILGENKNLIAAVYPCEEDRFQEMKNNCHLIAAAPEMLEALEQLVNAAHMQGLCRDDDSGLSLECSKASYAIAKAKGE